MGEGYRNMEQSGMNNLEFNACDDETFRHSKLTRLESGSAQKNYIAELFMQIPKFLNVNESANIYSVKIPANFNLDNAAQFVNGLLGQLAQFKPEELSNYLVLAGAQVAFNAFSSMVIASRQHYLTEINNNLKAINQKADKILEFLYGDKKAELMAEVRFVNFAYENYNSIMGNSLQRTATLVNVQESRKIAMKDIEFYVSDLDSMSRVKNISELDSFMHKAYRIKDCLQLAIQLYCMSNVLEVYYSQNTDPAYLKYVENDIMSYIDKCEKKMLADFSAIQMMVKNYKGNPLKKVDKDDFINNVGNLVDLLGSGEELIKRKPVRETLRSYQKDNIYYINKEGDLYLEAV